MSSLTSKFVVDQGTRQQVELERLERLQREQAPLALESIQDGVSSDDSSDDSSKRTQDKKSKKSTRATGDALPGTTKGRRSVSGQSSNDMKSIRINLEDVFLASAKCWMTSDTLGSCEISTDIGAKAKYADAKLSAIQDNLKTSMKLCSVCGFMSKYNCIRCGSRYCSIPCKTIHHETKCLKFAD